MPIQVARVSWANTVLIARIANEKNVVVNGTNSRYTGRGLFLPLDGIGETVWSLAAGGTSGGGGGGNGGLT